MQICLDAERETGNLFGVAKARAEGVQVKKYSHPASY